MVEGLRVRMAEDRDIDALVEFNKALAWETERKRLSTSVLTDGVRALLEKPEYGFYVVVETTSETVGCLMVTYEWSDWRCGVIWWIQSLYIKPDFRRQGVFRKLYEFIVEKASRNSNVCGFRVYVAESNQAAQRAYAKLGMEETYYKVYEAQLDK